MSTRINVSFFLIAAFAVIAVAGRSAVQGDAAVPPTNVLVTNTTAQAVPVKATNTFPVNLTNTANVHAFITNAANAPVNTNDATHGKDGYEVVLTGSIDQGISNGFAYLNAPPTGKRFVIQQVYISMWSLYSSAATTGMFEIQTNHQQDNAYVLFIPQVTGGGATTSTTSFRGPFYLDPNQSLTVNLYRGGSVHAETYYVTLTGYLVNYP